MKILFVLLAVISFNLFASADYSSIGATLYNVYNVAPTATAVLASKQSFTTGWVNVGSPVSIPGANTIAAWATLTAGASSAIQLRVLGSLTAAGTSYVIGTNNITDDATQVVVWNTYRLYPYVQLQVKADSTAGALQTVKLTAGK